MLWLVPCRSSIECCGRRGGIPRIGVNRFIPHCQIQEVKVEPLINHAQSCMDMSTFVLFSHRVRCTFTFVCLLALLASRCGAAAGRRGGGEAKRHAHRFVCVAVRCVCLRCGALRSGEAACSCSHACVVLRYACFELRCVAFLKRLLHSSFVTRALVRARPRARHARGPVSWTMATPMMRRLFRRASLLFCNVRPSARSPSSSSWAIL